MVLIADRGMTTWDSKIPPDPGGTSGVHWTGAHGIALNESRYGIEFSPGLSSDVFATSAVERGAIAATSR